MKNILPAATPETPETPKQLKPYEFKVDSDDNDGVHVKKIYAKHPSWVVYRTDYSIRIDIDDKAKNASEINNRHQEITTYLADIYSLLPEKINKKEPINRLIGRAIATNADGNTEKSKKILNTALERLVSLKKLEGRLLYAISAFAVVLLVFIICLICHNNIHNAVIKDTLNMVFFGSLGAALSVAVGFSTIEIDLDASWIINCLIGSSRIFIGAAASVFLLLAIRCEVAFSFVIQHSPWGVWMIGMVSGFVEKLVPSIMSNLVDSKQTS